MPLPNSLKKFSKGSLIQDEYFDGARRVWKEWKEYLQGKKKRPVKEAKTIQKIWGDYWGKRLFSVYEELKDELNQKKIPEPILISFKKKKISLSKKASIKVIKKDEEWEISDHREKWIIKREGEMLNAYKKGDHQKPEENVNVWIELLEDLLEKECDLSPQNPHQPTRELLPYPSVITERLLRRNKEFQARLQGLHQLVSQGWEE